MDPQIIIAGVVTVGIVLLSALAIFKKTPKHHS
jgi:hypothetical protein